MCVHVHTRVCIRHAPMLLDLARESRQGSGTCVDRIRYVSGFRPARSVESWGSAPAQKITFAEMRGRREWVHEGLFCYVNRHDRWYGPKPRR